MAKRGTCRLIAGRWRGRLVHFDEADGLRPTTDRIRETVFNWLQHEIAGSHCLDCFAGSGAMGFEALSRGAETVVLLDNHPRTITNLKSNAATLSSGDSRSEAIRIEKTDTLRWLKQHRQGEQPVFDVVFIDPPYQAKLLSQTCNLLAQSDLIREQSKIYLEHQLGDSIKLPEDWQCLKSKVAGQVAYHLYVKQQ